MNIEDELISLLKDRIKENETKTRNIEVIAYYYGFRGSSWPTLDETGKQFKRTRERIRQLIFDNFRKFADIQYFPTIIRISEIINSKRFWTQYDLENRLIETETAKDNFSIRGLFNLMEDLGMDNRYEIYSPDLEKAKRYSIDKYEQNFIIKDYDVKILKPIYKKAKKLPGRCGISNLNYLEGEFKDFSSFKPLLRDVIKYSENAWTKTVGKNFWYLFELKNNTLINFSEKAFSVFDNCKVNRLSETYRNALDRRTYKYPYPPIEIISDYLRSSIYFENNQDTLTFIGETTKLNRIEIDVVEYLKSTSPVRYSEFSSHLASKEYGEAHIEKDAFYSPLVYVDKSKGRSRYEYSLVGNLKGSLPNDGILNDRYSQFILKLRNISEKGTDDTVEQKKRREQRILKQWLFENKNQENCAICGNKYSVSALVAAHKKKRADCNEAERLDPYIVMPVCVFGCDYLYENRHIYIGDGIIKAGLPIRNKGQELKVLETLVGRQVDKEWLKGQTTYFETA